MTSILLSCPFCGNELARKTGRINPMARCITEGCIVAEKMSVINLDDPVDVERWNTRAQPAADPEMFRCNCPHEVRSGCSEPQCPHYTPPRTEQPAAARDEAFTLKGSETENLAQQLIDATKRSGVDTYTATLLWRASSLIDRLSASHPEQPAADKYQEGNCECL